MEEIKKEWLTKFEIYNNNNNNNNNNKNESVEKKIEKKGTIEKRKFD